MVLLGHALGCSLGILFRKGEGDMQYDDPRLMGVLITGLFGVEIQKSKKKLPFAENQAISEKMEM
jgi:hypothetical protein